MKKVAYSALVLALALIALPNVAMAATKNRDAVQSFNYAKTAEAEHAKLYSETLNNLPKLQGSKAKAYFVCTVCGYTTSQMDFSKCPSCFTHKDKYEKVS